MALSVASSRFVTILGAGGRKRPVIRLVSARGNWSNSIVGSSFSSLQRSPHMCLEEKGALVDRLLQAKVEYGAASRVPDR